MYIKRSIKGKVGMQINILERKEGSIWKEAGEGKIVKTDTSES